MKQHNELSLLTFSAELISKKKKTLHSQKQQRIQINIVIFLFPQTDTISGLPTGIALMRL